MIMRMRMTWRRNKVKTLVILLLRMIKKKKGVGWI